MSISFRVSRHLVRQVDVVEVWHGERFLATIVPPPETMGDMAGITIVSAHTNADGVLVDISKEPPVVFIPFDLQPKEKTWCYQLSRIEQSTAQEIVEVGHVRAADADGAVRAIKAPPGDWKVTVWDLKE